MIGNIQKTFSPVIRPQARAWAPAPVQLDQVQLAGGSGMHEAYGAARDFVNQKFGPGFLPHAIFARDAYDASGKARSDVDWQFNMTGKLGQEESYSFLKARFQPDKGAYMTDRDGPFPDNWNDHQKRHYVPGEIQEPDALMQRLLDSKFGKKYPSKTDYDVEMRYSDRLKADRICISWVGKREGQDWLCDVSFDAFTGQLLEEDACKTR